MAQPLEDFVAHALKKGMDHATVRMLLLSAGWREKDVAKALIAEGLDMPIPLPPDTGGAREAFFHLLTFAGLYTTFVSLLILFFTYINRWLPDAALQTYYSANADFSTIRWSMAAIIVAYPIFLWMSRLLVRDMTAHPERSVSGVRRWLTYLTLFLAAGTIIGDLITLVFYLLEGELSLRFILKVLVVLLLAGSVFSYYLLTLRNEPDHPKARAAHRNFFALSVVVVVAALVLGAWTVGSPGSERERKFDERRIEDLRTISNELHNIVYGGGARPIPGEQVDLQNPVPSTAQEVADSAFYTQLNLLDPETGVPYEYEKMSSTRVQLCAVFNAERSERYDIFWNHPAGHYCFDVDVTETRY